MPTVQELVTAGGVFIFTGGMGWWAHYVTTGAAKAHALARESQAIREDIRLLRRGLGEVTESVAGLHGKVDILVSHVGRNHNA